MKLIIAFLRLVRWPNLVFIAITQVLFVYCIVHPVFLRASITPNLNNTAFILLIISSVVIAAAGYIINDYFDLNIDLVNKPDKLVVEKIIHRRWVIIWHLFLSLTGITIGFYIDFVTNARFLGVANIVCVLLLFVYSISLKKKLLTGNVLISLLTAWVILVVMWCEASNLYHPILKGSYTRMTFLYAGFAFVISLIREVIKDMEDIEGDRKYACNTMPIAWGINASKVFIAVWLVVLIAALSVVQFYVLQHGWYWSAAYCILTIILPMLFLFKQLGRAKSPADYHHLSTRVKLIMFTGILSMVFFRIYI